MKPSEEKYRLRSYRAAWGAAVLSITLVLFMLGLVSLALFQAQELSDYVVENIGMNIELRNDAEDRQVNDLQRFLDNSEFALKTKFVSKEAAALQLAEELGEDFVGFIGYNPLPNAIELFLKSEYAIPDSVALIRQQLNSFPAVQAINYQESLFVAVERNMRRIGNGLIIFSLFLLFVSVLLIHNTIRLAVFAKRMLIKSMLLVGATQGFIRRPFILAGLLQGIVSSGLAVGMIWGFVLIISIKIPELQIFHDWHFIRLLSVGIVLFGLLVTWLSNLLAIKKYLKINSEELY